MKGFSMGVSTRGIRRYSVAVPLVHRGSALAELIVLCIAMIPLMFMVPMIGKLVDLRHNTIMAGRYVAWEEAMGPASVNSSQSTQVVGSRFFSSPESVILSGNSAEDSAAMDGVNPLWGSPSTRETSDDAASFWQSLNFQDSVYGNPASLQSSVDRSSLGGVAGAVSESVDTIATALNFASGVNWDLAGGEYSKGTVKVEAQIGNLLTPISSNCSTSGQAQGDDGAATASSSVCFTESNAILTDTWSVPATENVEKTIEEHTRAFVPASVLRPVGRFLSNIGRLPIVEELRGLEHAFGHVDAAPLPDGRSLGTYSN